VPLLGIWRMERDGQHGITHLLVDEGDTEAALGRLGDRFSEIEDFHVVVLPVEASIPRSERAEQVSGTSRKDDEYTGRISSEELYNDITDSFQLSRVWVSLVILSALVASIGLLRDSVVVVIGAMVIAPLLGPPVGLALATTLADVKLAWRAVQVGTLGLVAALAASLLLGLAIGAVGLPGLDGELVVDPTVPEIAARTHVDLSDIALALFSGAAGALSFTMGISAALIGVMVAVALLPPIVAAGLLAGAGHLALASQAGLLALTNLICINLAGVVTFAVQGIQPRSYYEAGRARIATVWAIVLWVALLAALIGLIGWGI
ncbi:MAG: TIGR00341 family protein, partial [Candidatus Thermoplasmatota archaeon]|nr:TIGR00341 family protein [Candidatus Thermoplasmatota archaeon]